MLKHFLGDKNLVDWVDEIANVSTLTENFTPKDLKHVAAKIQLQYSLGKW